MAKDPWLVAATARNRFADMIESLSDEQLDGETLCGAWTPRHILGHVTYLADFKVPGFFLGMAKAGFNYDKHADRMALELAKEPVDSLVARLRAAASKPAPMPGFVEMVPVGDVAIHLQDIRRPLGLGTDLDPEVLRLALEFVTTNKIGQGLADVGEGHRFEATDVDWSSGSGPTVSGPGETILMTLAGRISGELEGLST